MTEKLKFQGKIQDEYHHFEDNKENEKKSFEGETFSRLRNYKQNHFVSRPKVSSYSSYVPTVIYLHFWLTQNPRCIIDMCQCCSNLQLCPLLADEHLHGCALMPAKIIKYLFSKYKTLEKTNYMITNLVASPSTRREITLFSSTTWKQKSVSFLQRQFDYCFNCQCYSFLYVYIRKFKSEEERMICRGLGENRYSAHNVSSRLERMNFFFQLGSVLWLLLFQFRRLNASAKTFLSAMIR